MTITYRSDSSASGTILSGNNLTISVPSGVQDNDVLICYIYRDAVGADTAQTSLPAGWTKLTGISASDTSGRDRVIDIGWKVADEELSSYGFTNNGASSHEMQGYVIAYIGVDTTTPIDVTPTSSHRSFIENVAADELLPPPVTPNTSPTLAIIFGSLSNAVASDTSATAPSGYTRRFGDTDYREYAFICVADKPLSDTSQETPGYFVLSGWDVGDEGYTATILLREATVAGEVINRVLTENTVVTDPIPGYQLTQERPANSNVELLTDAAFLYYAFARLVIEYLSLTDQYIIEQNLRRDLSDVASLSDAIEVLHQYFRSVSDSIAVSDGFTKSITRRIPRHLR
jgi:hypothetical protein